MAVGEQRLAALERQVANLSAEVKDLRAQAFVLRTLEEMMVRECLGGGAPAVAPRQPRHLVALPGSGR